MTQPRDLVVLRLQMKYPLLAGQPGLLHQVMPILAMILAECFLLASVVHLRLLNFRSQGQT
jgi:hypothetical protein